MWGFETDPDFQRELDWIDAFVREEVQPLDHLLGDPYDTADPLFHFGDGIGRGLTEVSGTVFRTCGEPGAG